MLGLIEFVLTIVGCFYIARGTNDNVGGGVLLLMIAILSCLWTIRSRKV